MLKIKNNNYLVKVGNKEQTFELLKKLKINSNIKWANGDELDNQETFGKVYISSEGYLIIKGNAMYWADNYNCLTLEESQSYELHDIANFLKVVNNMKKKLDIKDVGIIISDDKYGKMLLDFLDKFTGVKFNSGVPLTDETMAEHLKLTKEKFPNECIVFLIKYNRLFIQICTKEEIELMRKKFKEDEILYDSVREFLLRKDEWIID